MEAKIRLLDENLSNKQVEEMKSSLNSIKYLNIDAKLNPDFYSHLIIKDITQVCSAGPNETVKIELNIAR